MKALIIIALFIGQVQDLKGQSFVRDLSRFQKQRVRDSKNSKPLSAVQNYNRSFERELDTIFKSYKRKTGFDFNRADSVFMIVSTPDDLLFFSDVLIWSGTDTLYYRQGYSKTVNGTISRNIEYLDFNSNANKAPGYQVVLETDSVINLIHCRNFNVLNSLGKNLEILDGHRLHIYFGIRSKYRYEIQALHPEKFFIPDTYRKL